MKIVSWNLNGLIATMRNSPFSDNTLGNPDVLCLQEIRTNAEPIVLQGYFHFWNHAATSGYAGTALLSKEQPIRTEINFGGLFPDTEGRIIMAEFSQCFVLNVYVPNAQKGGKNGLKRQAYRLLWDRTLLEYVDLLREQKPIILCGDFNVIRGNLDYYEENMRQHWATQGYASDEQSQIESLLELGFVDVFRELNPYKRSYTWWSNRLQKREEDRGWRLDYFFIPKSMLKKVKAVDHLNSVLGSDHCPIGLEVSL